MIYVYVCMYIVSHIVPNFNLSYCQPLPAPHQGPASFSNGATGWGRLAWHAIAGHAAAAANVAGWE